MTIAGLPGIPGGSALVPALDSFIADCLTEPSKNEVCGAFIYRHLEPVHGTSEIEWTGEIDWIRLTNVAVEQGAQFEINSTELMKHLWRELESLEQICRLHSMPTRSAEELFAAGFSPLVGIGHSHPSGRAEVSSADHTMSENAATWRRATAPGTQLHGPEEAKFFEADFLFAVDPETAGNGTLVHFKRGSVRGKWEGNFLQAS